MLSTPNEHKEDTKCGDEECQNGTEKPSSINTYDWWLSLVTRTLMTTWAIQNPDENGLLRIFSKLKIEREPFTQ